MANNEIRPLYAAAVDMTISLASIATGAGRIVTQVDNTSTRYSKVTIYSRIESGSVAPVLGESYRFYLVRDDGHATVYRSDGLGTADAAVTVEPENAQPLPSILVTATANKAFYIDFVLEDPGRKWSIVFWNGTTQTISTTEADSFIHFVGENPEIE